MKDSLKGNVFRQDSLSAGSHQWNNNNTRGRSPQQKPQNFNRDTQSDKMKEQNSEDERMQFSSASNSYYERAPLPSKEVQAASVLQEFMKGYQDQLEYLKQEKRRLEETIGQAPPPQQTRQLQHKLKHQSLSFDESNFLPPKGHRLQYSQEGSIDKEYLMSPPSQHQQMEPSKVKSSTPQAYAGLSITAKDMEVPINAIKERQKQELLTRMSSDPHMREAEFEIVSNHLSKDGNLGVYGAKANNYVGFGGGHSSGKPPRHRGQGPGGTLLSRGSSRLSGGALTPTSIYNLAKSELTTSQVSNEDNVARLRGRRPPEPDSRHRDRVPQNQMWLVQAEKTNVDGLAQHRYAHLLKYEKKAFQQHVNESFDKAFHPTDKQRLLDASHVFSLTTASIGAAKPTGRTSVNTSVYVHADPGGKGIDRLRDLYRAFVEEQEAMATREGGPGQNVNMADLLLNQVFSNPLHRGTEIVTDPAFLAYVEQNQKLTKKLRRLQGTKEVRSGEAGMALEPRFKVEEELFDGKHPVEGYQIGISEEQYVSEKERYLQHTQFLMQQREVGYDIQTTATLKRGNEIDKQLRDIRRVKAYDEIVQEALAKRDAEELRLKEIKAAAWQIKKDLREAQEKQTEAERRRREDEEERERWGVIKDGDPPKKKDEVVQEVEDCLDVEALKARIVQLEGSETLSKSWVRETLVMNLTQVIADVAEIRAIQALPEEQEHEIPEDERYHGLVVMSMVHEEKVQSAMHRKEQRVQRLRDKIVFRIKAADEQFGHLVGELDYAWRVLEEQPLEDLVKELHPNFRALREEDYPAKQGSPPANVREKEEALSEILKRHSRTPSPERPPAEGEEGPNILGRSPEKIVADQRAVEEQEMMKTLAQNQRLMDVADNTDELLRQYAGGQETRDPKKYFMFFQRADPILKEDGGEQAARLRILNLGRPEFRAKPMKKKVQFTGGADKEEKTGGSPDPASTTKASEEPSQPKKEQTNKLSFHQLRQMASDMPSNVAVKLQGRSLASIGEFGAQKNPERYMYQYLARQRVHDRLVAEGKLAPVQEVNENSLSSQQAAPEEPGEELPPKKSAVATEDDKKRRAHPLKRAQEMQGKSEQIGI